MRFFWLIASLTLIGCRPTVHLGSDSRPLKLLLFPTCRGERFEPARAALASALSATTGLRIETRVPIDYLDAIEKLGAAEVDVALLNNLSYLLAEDTYQVEARLAVLRSGGRRFHRAQILVRRDSTLRSLIDLTGKRVAFVDPYSVTGFVVGAHLLTAHGVKAGSTTFVGSHEEVVRQVFTRDADAGATYDDGSPAGGLPVDVRTRLQERYPSIGDELIALAKSDPIPNEPVVFRRDLGPALTERLIAGLVKLREQPAAAAALLTIDDIVGFDPASGADYAPLRGVIGSLGKEVEEMVPGGWRLRLKTPAGF
ncbi:MAG: phosphate/phosphite/phosphonate ABC transporter substrate-binding protein [Deltaproteobacteria bacterium]|nr:phosphate/phosphite/phosphonate ABC transporter substrate-binding protein [Deltaproteobacteria bacterium]